MLKLPTMSMDIFKNVLENIDENYPFSLSPKLILALLILTGVCTIVIGILFIWYKRKTSFTSSTMGNLLKLIPSLNEKTPTLNSLLPILSELAPSQNIKNALTSVTVPQLSQTPPDEPSSTTCIGSKTTNGNFKTTNNYICSIPYISTGTTTVNFN